jgi:glycosyltransferase involved in cell wall biosynthesis
MSQAERDFNRDPFPSRPKILFVGLAESTHARSWIDLLKDAELNVRLFALPGKGIPPADWRVRTYLTWPDPPEGLASAIRQCLYPTPEQRRQAKRREAEWYLALARNPWLRIRQSFTKGFTVKPNSQGFFKTFTAWLILLGFLPIILLRSCFGLFRRTDRRTELPESWTIDPQPHAESAEAWLAQIIREWQPDIIHTLGLWDGQGGAFYHAVRHQYDVAGYGRWVLQLRGGSDLTLNRHDPDHASRIAEILNECDQIISDNRQNIAYAAEMGIPESKFAAALVPVPGTGGIDVDALARSWHAVPSRRSRLVIVPKAYETTWAKALNVFEAIRLAWDGIQPCEIYFLWMMPETEVWFRMLPLEIRRCSHVYGRIPREQVLELMGRARVMLAPSLVDGVPNSLYEAMACGAFPIVSPLETLTPVVQNEINVLWARNLYPGEIAEALVRAMNDDDLIDRAARANLALVRSLADRATIGPRVVAYYESLATR